MGILRSSGDLELPHNRLSGRGNLAASRAAETIRCRQLLADLLRPLDAVSAPEWADLLIDAFGTLAGVFASEISAKMRVLGANHPAHFLESVREAILHSLRTAAFAGPVLSTAQAVIDYLRMDLAFSPVEHVRVLFLDAQNHLLKDVLVGLGSASEVPISSREIMRRAVCLNAAGLILVHNHPSGDPSPSGSDRAATAIVAKAAQTLDVRLHDHLIVGRAGWMSFRQLGLL